MQFLGKIREKYGEKPIFRVVLTILFQQAEVFSFCQDYPRPPISFADTYRLNRPDTFEPDQKAEFAACFALPVIVTAADQVVVLLFELEYLFWRKVLEVFNRRCRRRCTDRPAA